MLPLSRTETEQGIFEQVLHGDLDFSSDPWPSISEGAKDLVQKMLVRDPKRRLTAHQVLCKSFKSKHSSLGPILRFWGLDDLNLARILIFFLFFTNLKTYSYVIVFKKFGDHRPMLDWLMPRMSIELSFLVYA